MKKKQATPPSASKTASSAEEQPSTILPSRTDIVAPNGVSQAMIWFSLILGIALAFGLSVSHSNSMRVLGSIADHANMLYLITAIVTASATLLLSGIIVLAPILSLSLHQSYDQLFDIAINYGHNGERLQKVARQIAERLISHRNFYRRLNPVYQAIWFASIIALFVFTVRIGRLLAGTGELDKSLFMEATIFVIISAALCVCFAGVSFLFFFFVRPGITKLQYYSEILEATVMGAATTPPADVNKNFISMAIQSFFRNVRQSVTVQRRHTLQLLIGVILLGVVAVSLWRYINSDQYNKPEVTVAVNSTALASTPVFVATDPAMEGGERIHIVLKPFASGRFALDALIGGQVDVATVADLPVVRASVLRPDLRVIFTLAISPLKIVGRRSKGITEIKSLVSKRVGTLIGASPDYYLSRVLEKHGIPEDGVKRVNGPPSDALLALLGGSIDAMVAWEPIVASAADQMGDDFFVDVEPEVYVERFNLVTTQAVLDDPLRRQRIVMLMSAIMRATKKIRSDEVAVRAIAADRTGAQIRYVQNAWSDFSFPSDFDSSGLLDSLTRIESRIALEDPRTARDSEMLGTLIDRDLYALAQLENQ